MTADEQIKKAAEYGKQTYADGGKCVPYRDKRLMDLIAGRSLGVTPPGEAGTIAIIDAWLKAFQKAAAEG